MENNKEMIDILKEVQKSIKRGQNSFICNSIIYLSDEYGVEIVSKVLKYFKLNKPNPKQHVEFFNNHSFINSITWWRVNPEGREQRILFLDKLIKQLEDENK